MDVRYCSVLLDRSEFKSSLSPEWIRFSKCHFQAAAVKQYFFLSYGNVSRFSHDVEKILLAQLTSHLFLLLFSQAHK